MTEYLVSIVIPVYKVESFLPKCIESAINQTYQNIEIILVDDGSPDSCGVICDRYRDIDTRIKVIHQPNKGLSAARNAGIQKSTGDFIFHLDGDDYLPKDAIDSLVKEQIRDNYDLVFGNFDVVKSNEIGFIDRDYENDKLTFIERMVSDLEYHHFVWGILIRKFLYIKNNIHPIECVNVGEDLQVLPQLIYFSNKYSKISTSVYEYNRANSSSLTAKQSYNRFSQDIKSINILECFLEQQNQKTLYERLVNTELNMIVGNIYCSCVLFEDSNLYKELVKYTRCTKFQNELKKIHYSSKIAIKLNMFFLARTWYLLFNKLTNLKSKL